MTRQILSVTAFVVAATLSQLPVTAAKPGGDGPTIVDLGTLGGTFSEANGINNDPNDIPGDMESRANDVNDSGTVVGVSISSTGVNRAFRWTPSPGMVALPGLGGNTSAVAIASNGDVAGTSVDAAGNSHAVRWRAGAYGIEDPGTLGGCCSGAFGINNAGTVVGVSDVSRRGNQRAFLARPGARMTELGGPRGQSAARALNDFGTIAGGIGNGPLHAAIWKLR